MRCQKNPSKSFGYIRKLIIFVANKQKETTLLTIKIQKVMTKLTIKILLIIAPLLAICYYGIYRNNKVLAYKNQLWVQRLWMDYDNHDDYIRDIESRYTYLDFFFSFKPMKSKYWFTQEEIDKYQLELVDKASELNLP